MRAVLIPAEGDPHEIDVDSLDGMRLLLECRTIEALSVGRDDATAYGDEEAKLIQREVACPRCAGDTLPPGDPDRCATCNGRSRIWVEGLAENSVATALIYGEKESARERGEAVMATYRAMGFEIIDQRGDDTREPYIAGDVVVTGFDPRTGVNTPIPDDLAASILGDRS